MSGGKKVDTLERPSVNLPAGITQSHSAAEPRQPCSLVFLCVGANGYWLPMPDGTQRDMLQLDLIFSDLVKQIKYSWTRRVMLFQQTLLKQGNSLGDSFFSLHNHVCLLALTTSFWQQWQPLT